MKSQIEGIVAAIYEDIEQEEGLLTLLEDKRDDLHANHAELMEEMQDKISEQHAKLMDMHTTIKCLKEMTK